MARDLDSPAGTSPVSPTFTPTVSSLNRSFSPSNPVRGKLAAGVSVCITTNSWVSFPVLVTKKVTFPAGAWAAESWMNISMGEGSAPAASHGLAQHVEVDPSVDPVDPREGLDLPDQPGLSFRTKQ